jgi:F-type H+-transporting ATPase subunit delta
VRNAGIARNYAEALFALGTQDGRLEEYAGLIEAVAAAIGTSPEVEAVLMSPNVPKAKKAALVGDALKAAPRAFTLFVQAVVRRGRQDWFADIAREYGTLVDAKFNRLRAAVTTARQPDAALQEQVRRELSRAFGKEVLPTFVVEPAILGGAVVKVGDRVYDGSVRRRLARLRRQLLAR